MEGGISILGTSGIVEPMSVQALVDTMALELRQASAWEGRRLILTPGNYGMEFLRSGVLGLPREVPIVKCSNFVGEALDSAGLEGFREILLVGHIGKFVKLAAGIFNTHSRWADGRREMFGAHAALCGADRETVQALMDSATADRCLEILAGKTAAGAGAGFPALRHTGAPGPAVRGGGAGRRGPVQQSIRPAGPHPGGEGDHRYMERANKLGTFYGVGSGAR